MCDGGELCSNVYLSLPVWRSVPWRRIRGFLLRSGDPGDRRVALAGNRLVVNLIDEVSRKPPGRSYVSTDGGFEFRDVPAGVYTVEISAASGEPFSRQTVSLKSGGDQIEVRLPSINKRPPGAGTVSLRELQYPLSSKSKKIFSAAQKASDSGEYLKAVEILRGALNEAPEVPFARMNIGLAYLKAGQPSSARATTEAR